MVLERIQAVPFSEIQELYPDKTVIDVANLPEGSMTVTYDDPAADPLIINLLLSWKSIDLGNMSWDFMTMRTE